MDYLLVGVVAAVLITAVNALAPKVGVAPALVLMVLGVLISLVPAVPAIEIEPEWILAGVLPPLLYSTSVGMPAMDFRRDFTAIGGLSVTLVVGTSVALGALFSLLIPGIGLATGIALGAIISPTDAVATTVVRRLGVGPRVVTVLEGESLLNDASALVLLRSAIAATAASVSLWHVAGSFVYAVLVAVVVGYVVGQISLRVRARLPDPHLTTAISFIVPFLAYLPAERLGASGLVATVAAGLVTGYGSAKHLRPQDRMAETANWRTLELLLEGGVFLVMGVQLYGLVEDVLQEDGDLARALGLGALAGAIVILVRLVYVGLLVRSLRQRARRAPEVKDYLADLDVRIEEGRLDEGAGRPDRAGQRLSSPASSTPGPVGPGPGGPRRRSGAQVRAASASDRGPGRRPRAEDPEQRAERESSLRVRITRRIADIDYLAAEPFGWREGAVLVWAGMRGVVTLAAAQSLPLQTPQRSLLVLIAFVVAAGTLLVQGGTLPWLVRRLGLVRGGDDGVERRRLIAELQAMAIGAVDDPELRRANGQQYDDVVLERARIAVRDLHTAVRDDAAGMDDDDAAQRGAGATDEGAAAAVESAVVETRGTQYRELRLAVIEAQRARLLHVRSLGTFSSAALTTALSVLDADQISIELRSDS